MNTAAVANRPQPLRAQYLDLRANVPSAIGNQSRDITGTSGKIDDAGMCIRPEPAAYKAQNKTVAAKPAIELPNTFEVAL